MENSRFWVKKKVHGKNGSLHGLCKDRELSNEESAASQLKSSVKSANSQQAIVLKFIQSQVSKLFLKDLFFLLVHGHTRIPKHIVSADEIYLRHCLEFIHIDALKAFQCNMPVSLRDTNMGTSLERLNTGKFIDGDGRASSELVYECPESVVMNTNTAEQWTLGTIMGSKSVMNILNSPILQQYGNSDRNDNLNSKNFPDAKDEICYDFMDSPSGFSISSSNKLGKETPMEQIHKYGSNSVHKRFASTSRSNSTCSDRLSSATSTLSQGMLTCTWKQGIPHFVFYADDKKEVYVANLSKVDPSDDKGLDYVYLFHLHKGDQKGSEISDSDLQVVGKMNVSTSFTLCPNNCRIMETQFILFGNFKFCDKEMFNSSHSYRENKGLSKKVSVVFRTSPSLKHRKLSKSCGSSATVESCPRKPQPCDLGGTNLLETNAPPNFELGAIVIKDDLPFNKVDKVGGWGLKFLNKSGVNQSTLTSGSCSQNIVDCSTSMSIIVPAGLHGGPRTRHGGPSGLIDRWKSGGRCDCGGWDEGCPLTVLQRRSSNAEVLSQADMQGECKSVDLVTQGSSNFSPTLRMVNVHDGLYFIHFQPSLSALQCFSFAIAIIHGRSPTLRPLELL